MKHSDFSIGLEFLTDTGQWRCTDVGTRTIVAIPISRVDVTMQANDGNVTTEIVGTDSSWFNGSPYAVTEHVFDEHDMAACKVS